jgi:hypothetical protein
MGQFTRAATRFVGFVLALVSYWAPWVWHPVVGLQLTAEDLAEFPKFMPQVRANEIFAQREVFYCPLLVLATGLVVWVAHPPSPSQGERPGVRVARWLMRLFACALPFVSTVFHFYEPSEFAIQRNFAVIVVALIILTPLLRRLPHKLLNGLLGVWFMLGAILPTAQYFWMKPALDEIYHRPIVMGWGVWANVIGFGLLAFSTWTTEERRKMEHKELT